MRYKTPTYAFEQEARSSGFSVIAGVDEAGRGPLAGPVVAGAVIFGDAPIIEGLRDSKTLCAKRRAALLIDIYRRARAIGIGICWPDEIDALNIHQASLLAMKRAVALMPLAPDYIMVDGKFKIDMKVRQRAIVSGDALSLSICAASIVAKTARDAIMEAYHSLYPAYGFMRHKGYGTKEHMSAIIRYGACPIHRKSFSIKGTRIGEL